MFFSRAPLISFLFYIYTVCIEIHALHTHGAAFNALGADTSTGKGPGHSGIARHHARAETHIDTSSDIYR